MNTIKIYLAESGRIANLHKDFPLYQYQYQNKLLNVYVPTSIMAPQLSTQDENGQTLSDYVAGTDVKISSSCLQSNGEIKVSTPRYMRYLKTLTYQNVEYALYERKLPKEFTLYAGQGANAPVLTINVVNVETDTETPQILSITTSQTCRLDVMPSTNLDIDEAIEPSELETLNSEIQALKEAVTAKQDKVDENINITTDSNDDATWQDSQSVVGAINNNTAQTEINRTNIEDNTSTLAQVVNDIDYLYNHLTQPENYIGQMTVSSLPTDSQLTAFVEETVDREPKNADVVIVVLEISGETDKNYKYIYSVDGWNGYEIPSLEPASNGSLGLLKGTYNVGSSNNTLVDISGGEILNIYVKDNTNTFRNIREYLNTNGGNISNIINGTTSVGQALKALADGLGNNIVNTYLTKNEGATKTYVRDYALPKQFNDISFITSDGYSSTLPTDVNPQFTVQTSSVGSINLFTIYKEYTDNLTRFELSSRNTAHNSIYIRANRDCTVQFRLTTQALIPNGAGNIDTELLPGLFNLDIVLTTPIEFEQNVVQKIDFDSIFTYLGEDVITVGETGSKLIQILQVVTQESTSTTFDIYSNETFPSTFNLNTTSLVIYHTLGELGEQPTYSLAPTGDITASGIDLVGDLNAQINKNTECKLTITIPISTTGYSEYFGENCIINSITLGGQNVRLVTPYNFLSGKAKFGDLTQVNHYIDATNAIYEMKCFIEIDGSSNVSFIVDEDNISNKVDKTSSQNKLYGTDGSGNQTTISYDSVPTGNIPRRDSNQQIDVPQTPTSNTHATSKKYVDDTAATKQNSLSSAQLAAVNSGITADKIMSSPATTSENPLVNKEFVNVPWTCYLQVTGRNGDRNGFSGNLGIKYKF